MSVFWCVIFGLMLVSYANAQQRGVPWFSMGQSSNRGRKASSLRSLRTASIKPKSPHLRQQSKTNAQPIRQKPIPSKKLDRVATASFCRLNELTHSVELTQRLIDRVQERNPHRDRVWCAEKAIYDLERDRMAR